MPVPTYFGSNSNPVDSASASQAEPATLIVVGIPDMKPNDLVIFIGHMQVASTGQITISETGGQAWLGPYEVAANDQVFAVFWCAFTGIWTASPSLAFAAQGGTQAATAIMHIFRCSTGCVWALDTPMAGGAEASASPVIITGITPVVRNTVTLAGWAVPNASTWGTLSGAGWIVTGTAQYRNIAGTDQSASFAHFLQAGPSATGDVSLVPSSAAAGLSFIISWKAYPRLPSNYQFVTAPGGVSVAEKIR